MRQGIYCDVCNGVEITPEHRACPKCHTQYSDLVTKYLYNISVFENELTKKLKSHGEKAATSEREIYILHHILYTHAKKYFVPQNEYRIRNELRYVRYLALRSKLSRSKHCN